MNGSHGSVVISTSNISCNVKDGVYSQGSYYTTIFSNIIGNNNGTGITLNMSTQCFVYNNTIHGNALGSIIEIKSLGNKIFENDCGACNTLARGEGLIVLLAVAGIAIAVPLLSVIVFYEAVEVRKREDRKGGASRNRDHASEGKVNAS